MKIGALGEFGLIDRIAKVASLRSPRSPVAGIGDDAAVFRGTPGKLMVATCDCQVKAVHFRMAYVDPFNLGRRLAAVNLSDIAAMGAQPTFALVSVGLPDDLDVAFVERVYEGLRSALGSAGAAVIGGNTARMPDGLFFDLFLLGEVDEAHILYRHGARLGDVLCVTGCLGGSAAGLALLESGKPVPETGSLAAAVRRHLEPTAQLRAGELLGGSGRVSACMDVSDGVLADAGHLAAVGGVCIAVDWGAVPVDPCAVAAAEFLGVDPRSWAVGGGEDFELLFTVDPSHLDEITSLLHDQVGVAVTPIGQVITGPPEAHLIGAPEGTVLGKSGFDHFR